MDAGKTPRILIRADGPAQADLRLPLEKAGYAVTAQTFDDPDPDTANTVRLILIDSGQSSREALQLCRRLRHGRTGGSVPLLGLTGAADPAARVAFLECGADACLLRPFATGELLAQVRALLRLKDMHDWLGDKTAEIHRVNQRLQQAYQQLDEGQELARRIQGSLLPQALPETPHARLAVCYRPCGRAGGDSYDVFQLDEKLLGFYVADAMGHGIQASFMTLLVKLGVRANRTFGRQDSVFSPDELLCRLNHELIGQALSGHPFVTMVYALFDCQDQTLRISRAGHPPPLHVPRSGNPELWTIPGTWLGVFETAFVSQSYQLSPGDKVLLYTDGLDRPDGSGRLLQCAARFRELPLAEFIDRLFRELHGSATVPAADDITLLGLEVGEARELPCPLPAIASTIECSGKHEEPRRRGQP
jgi:serine phosphatase RsbU (regulator of sigma subunit)